MCSYKHTSGYFCEPFTLKSHSLSYLSQLYLLFQLALDDSLLRNDMMEIKDVWSIRASNMPRAGDSSVPNPGRV